jgi:hypothetical protein
MAHIPFIVLIILFQLVWTISESMAANCGRICEHLEKDFEKNNQPKLEQTLTVVSELNDEINSPTFSVHTTEDKTGDNTSYASTTPKNNGAVPIYLLYSCMRI